MSRKPLSPIHVSDPTAMLRLLVPAFLATVLALSAAQATTLHEGTAGEFGDVFSAPTDFTGRSRIEAQSNGHSDFEYFRFDTLFADTTRLEFTLTNLGQGSNMGIRLSSTPFTMAEWDWTVSSIGTSQLYANQWAPTSTYSLLLPSGFTGPLYGFAQFYSTNSPSSLVITQNGTALDAAPVPLPASVLLLLAGIGGLGALRAWRRTA